MLLKLLIPLTLLAHNAAACCLPDTYQVTMLSDSHYGENNRFRARIVVAVDAATRRAAIHSASDAGQVSAQYVDFRSGRLFAYVPPYGCYESQIDLSLANAFNESRCVPDDILAQPRIPIKIAQRVESTLYSGTIVASNTTVDALISNNCEPIIVKVKGPGYRSINIFGDIHLTPQPEFLNLPPICQNATWVGSRKRGLVTLGYGTSLFSV